MQLSIFDIINIAPESKDNGYSMDPVLKAVVQSGGNKEGSKNRIYLRYRAGKDAAYMERFIRNEIGTTGKGLEINGEKYSVWYDSGDWYTDGVRINNKTYTWQDIEDATRTLVENGEYVNSFSTEPEYERIADKLFFYFREKKKCLELITDKRHYSDCMKDIVDQLKNNPEIILWIMESIKGDPMIREDIKCLINQNNEYPIKGNVEELRNKFVTEDELSSLLATRGSNTSNSKIRIQNGWSNNKAENIKLLKAVYGVGGCTHALKGCSRSYMDYDAKGLKIVKGPLFNPDVEVLYSWNQIEDAIDKLISSGKYIEYYVEDKEKKSA